MFKNNTKILELQREIIKLEKKIFFNEKEIYKLNDIIKNSKVKNDEKAKVYVPNDTKLNGVSTYVDATTIKDFK